MNHQTFAVGDQVRPIPERFEQIFKFSFQQKIDMLGPQPLKVIKIENKSCSCDKKIDKEGTHSEGCLLSRIGHLQIITIQTQQGLKKFSGSFFKK